MATPDLDAAAQFLAANARVLDRRRFDRLFSGGDARPVRDAVAAFRNSDGGFGHALEPDGRTPASQPPAVGMALRTLDEAVAWDEELVAGACEWLAANAPDEGGVTIERPLRDMIGPEARYLHELARQFRSADPAIASLGRRIHETRDR